MLAGVGMGRDLLRKVYPLSKADKHPLVKITILYRPR